MIELDFLRKACARETADEQQARLLEIFDEVMAEREEAGRRLRLELKQQ